MRLGNTTRSYSGFSNEETARMLAEGGFCCTELCFVQADSNFWRYNSMGPLDGLTSRRVGEIAEIYRKNGIEITSLGLFTNCICPDEAQNALYMDYFETHMRFAAENGIKTVSTECGANPDYRGLITATYEKYFSIMLENMKKLAETAEKLDITIAIEPCSIDIIPSAKRMRDFIFQVGSDRIKVLLDPANLIANSDEDDMFKYLLGHIAYFHGKDRKVNAVSGCLLGDGDVDWTKFLSLYEQYTPDAPFILEYVNPTTEKTAVERINEVLKKIQT